MSDELSSTLTLTVTEADTAIAMGSGSLPVLGTPRLLAWMEQATCTALDPELTPGETSVGTRVTLEHSAAASVGQTVTVLASQVYADGRLRRFTVAARRDDALLATAEITRVVVSAERFMSRLG
jgi:fluoroacetyl-CoA thioesterase